MELNISSLMARSADMYLYSASIAEIGEDAGVVTWQNAMDCVEDNPLVKEEDVGEFRDYLRTFGAWWDSEIDAYTIQECNALCLQLIAGEIREREGMENPEESDLYEINGEWFIYLGV